MATRTIHTCDRCKRELAKDQLKTIQAVYSSDRTRNYGDLCLHCSTALSRFMAGQGVPPPSEDKIVFHDGSELS